MLYDLNIPWTPSTDPAALDRTLAFSATLGYNVVALNYTLNPPIPSQITNPLPKPNGYRTGSSSGNTTNTPTANPTTTPSAATATATSSATPRTPTILHRATLVISDPSHNYRLSSLASAYDILAVRPTTEKAFSVACLSLSEPSLISLDLTTRFPFHFKPKSCMAAVSRGLRFEICYGQALSPLGADPSAASLSPADLARARALFISNLANLVRVTKGRGLVVSSEARSALGLRGPADVVNLLAVWGLATDKGNEALGANPRGVVVNEGLKRDSFKGVVRVVETGAREGDGKAEGKKKSDEAGGKRQQKKGGAKKSGQKAAEGTGTASAGGDGEGGASVQKRKSDDINNSPRSKEGEVADQEGTQAMSKRQAKRLRLAQRKAAERNSS